METLFECRRLSRPLNQRSDFVEAKQKMQKDCTTNIQQSLEMETNLSLLGYKSGNNLEASKNTITDLKLVQDVDTSSRTTHSSSSSHWQPSSELEVQFGAGIRGRHHPGLSFRLPEIYSSGNRRCVRTAHLPRTIFSHAQLSHRLVFTCCQSVQSHIEPMQLHGSSHEAHCLRFAQKHLHLIAQCRTPCRT